ncbi:alpha/beta hydrolase [Fredinandcohnia sp. QZ13]|uniref:alpha/beta hydrolase n=1 Tax=Fredinandcohnia sp. QZ13 TaxID=3073144 RepID=UPI0028530969|nr:alpha/beta hydrolase [Fredinandcohnia sp. QZ13]MDR4887036.1 alpha/beta hydrolase [Fredinandcohnia sp. QZ13]
MVPNKLFFKLDTEWSALHLPKRPNGFAVLIIGDKTNFVEENSSYWIQNYARSQILEYLKDEGYTVFYSNLYGANWGNPASVKLATQLYHIIMKREILNTRIHILAEGMGALTAMQLSQKLNEEIRSMAFLNPCIDLVAHIDNERKNKFFYKKLIKEIAQAYQLDEKEVESNIEKLAPNNKLLHTNIPIKIWRSTNERTYTPEIHSKKYQGVNEMVTLSYHISENTYAFSRSIGSFFKENEKEL